ncbi:MAG TPA: ABC transporter permease [Steroidobacteraceae bacterium]|nr:ABC transporter permease [Steroidobacteraceae bacterium]
MLNPLEHGATGHAAQAATGAAAADAPGSLAGTTWIGFRTIVHREYSRIIRIWAQTLVPSAVNTALYLLIFGTLFGRRVGAMAGFSYAQFLIPGMIMTWLIQNSYANVVSSFYGAKFGKHIEELLVSPLPNWVIVAGYMMGGIVRGMLVAMVVTAVSLVFARLPIAHPGAIVAAALLTSAAFALAGLINAVFAKNFDQVNFVPTFVLQPLTYLAGVFYSINMLPHAARVASLVNPILYMVNAFRYGFLGVSDVALVPAFAMMAALAIVLFIVAVVLMNRGAGIRD